VGETLNVAKLVVRKGRNSGAEYRLNADRLTMGRRSASPIPVLDPKSSREHAVVTRKGDLFFLQDLSRNGTLVNGQPASRNAEHPTPLHFGDKIQIGDTEMELIDESKEPIGIEIPGYKILEKIGHGGMGTVYKARQLSMDRVVALKVLSEKYSANREFVDRFIREARAAGRLNHPNVIHVHDVSKVNQLHFFSMEFVDGFSLKELLRIQGKLEPGKILDIALQTAKALEFAHENGIVHRDIKPDNIMITKDGVVKLADLGIAKSFDEETANDATHQQRRVLGTPHYMAPEQALGKEIDHRVDIYALGATMYHTLTGHTPFTGSTAHEVIRAHIQESLPPIQEFSPQVPDALCFIVERMMAKMPEKRYPNMTRLIEDLERCQKGVVAGIERIEEGHSTILPALKDGEHKLQRPKTEEIGTGVHAPVQKMLTYALLVALFIALVAVVMLMLKTPGGPDADPDATKKEAGGVVESTDPEKKPAATSDEARQKVDEARRLLEADPASEEAEKILSDLSVRFPTLDEPKKLLAEVRASRTEAARRKAESTLKAATDFEQEHQGDEARYAEIIQRFRNAEVAAAGMADLAQRAKERGDYWTNRVQEARLERARAAWSKVAAAIEQACGQRDFDAARQALRGFADVPGQEALKAEVDAKAASIKKQADGFFERAKEEAQRREKDPAHPVPLALRVWTDYLASVKDSENRGQAEAARKALETRADNACAEEDKRIADLAAQYDFDGAAGALRILRERFSGTKWAEERSARLDELGILRDLHKRVVAAIAQRVRTGNLPIPLPFKVQVPRFDVQDWGIGAACDNDQTLRLDAIVKGAAPGAQKRFADLPAGDVYRLYTLFVPPVTAEDHKAYAVFCKERGLENLAQEHTLKSAQ